jgi:glycosyltransferase involved in cell wall biosynthesis/uncharacterized protein YbaR (Trm112 family)
MNPTVYQLGNSEYHRFAFEQAREYPGIVVLHDVVLHHGRLIEFVRSHQTRAYRRLMHGLYGEPGKQCAESVLNGRMPDDLMDFPLFEDYVETACLTLVHSEHARRLVQARVPGARVERVAMGIPLPALIEQQEARNALGIDAETFVIASITHVNPYKRIPVVLRALRQATKRVRDREIRLVVAGSVSPEIDLHALVATLGLERHVRIAGYVSDAQARLLARAADVCVNLRYPTTGETSASLLRLLGAGRAVIVTAGEMAGEFPTDGTIAVPVDRYEEETLAELFVELARSPDEVSRRGTAARVFVEEYHSMPVAVAGYRDAVRNAFNHDLPPVPEETRAFHEARPVLERGGPADDRRSAVDEAIALAMVELALDGHESTVASVSLATVSLGIDRLGHGTRKDGVRVSGDLPIPEELLEILACPVCKTAVRLEGLELVCDTCRRRYQIVDGIPVMLADEEQPAR